MSTRCQTFITCKKEPVATIYRHYDGYPSGMGRDLIEMCHKTTIAQELVVKILTAWNFEAQLEEINANHGDTEYEYYVDFPCCSYESAIPTVTIRDMYTLKQTTIEAGSYIEAFTELDKFEKDLED